MGNLEIICEISAVRALMPRKHANAWEFNKFYSNFPLDVTGVEPQDIRTKVFIRTNFVLVMRQMGNLEIIL